MTAELIIGIALSVFLLFILLPAFVVYKLAFSKRNSGKYGRYHTGNPAFIPYKKEMDEAESFLRSLPVTEEKLVSYDNAVLYGDYYNRNSSKTVIMAHGYSTMPFDNFSVAAMDLYNAGYNILLIYERTHGKSGGRCSTLGIKESGDIILWTDYIYSKYKTDIALYGVSMGCAAISYASDSLDKAYVKAMILDCGFESPYNQIKYECSVRHTPGVLLLPLIVFFAKKEHNINIKESVRDSLEQTDIPALFINGEKDATVTAEIARKNYESCKSEKEWVLVKSAPHAMAYVVGRSDLRWKITGFLQKYMEDNK